MNQVDQLLMDRPAFHASGSACHGLSNEALRFLHEHVNAESRTLETGNGMSTVLFAMARCHHTCISPIQSEVELIKQY